MFKIGLIFFGLLFGFFSMEVKAQLLDTSYHHTSLLSLKKTIHSGLNYLEKTQCKQTIISSTYRGEWKTSMGLRKGFFLLGKNGFVDDSNCFSIASTHNSLAQIYLMYPEYVSILNMLDLSFDKLMTYRNGNKFNFWNLLPPNRKLRRGDIIGQQPMVRRPTHYKLKTKFINNAANVAEDADDTSLAYEAIALRKKVYARNNKVDTFSFCPNSFANIVDSYRDVNRNNRHWYNFLYGNDKETGVYLTWLADEYQFRKWNVIKDIGHNATFFLPFSECYPHAYVPYVPYGSNDIDAVVNANVLNTLSMYNELDADGVINTIEFIEQKSKENKYDRIGIYYPNRYQFAFSVSNAYANGVDELHKSTQYLLDYIIENQNENGSWSSRRAVNKKDKIQSTTYALNALINFGSFHENNTIPSITRAIEYLMNNSVTNENGIHWNGGVFFSGGTVIRNTLYWKSDAYTTALVIKAIAGYRLYYERNLMLEKL